MTRYLLKLYYAQFFYRNSTFEHRLLSIRRFRECKELFKYIIIKTLITTHLCALVSS